MTADKVTRIPGTRSCPDAKGTPCTAHLGVRVSPKTGCELEGLEIKAKKVKELLEPKLRMGKSENVMP